MWALIVLTLLPDLNDARVTIVDEYNSQWDCNNARELLEQELKALEALETATCFQISPTIPDIDRLY